MNVHLKANGRVSAYSPRRNSRRCNLGFESAPKSLKKLFTPSIVQAFVNKRLETVKHCDAKLEARSNFPMKSQTRLFSIN